MSERRLIIITPKGGLFGKLNFETWRSGNAPEDPLIYKTAGRSEPATNCGLQKKRLVTRLLLHPTALLFTSYTAVQPHLIMPMCV